MPVPEKLSATWTRATRGILWATPGQLDAGFTSLATFVAGLSAVRNLGSEALGAYALLFSAFLVASQVPTELIFSPSQVLAIDLEPGSRLGVIRHSLPRGVLLSLLSAAFVPMGVIPVLDLVPAAELTPLLVSAALLTAVSPLQDHLRSMFHLSDASWAAAATSATHLIGTVVSLLVLTDMVPSGAPFGALVAGKVLSLSLAGSWIALRSPALVARPHLRQLTSLGGWLLTTGVTRSLLGYASRVLLNTVVGITALGQVEGARIVAQPLYVLASGLMAQVGPRAMEAASRHDLNTARRWRRRFGYLLSFVALPYALATAIPSPINPMFVLAPRAYEVPGLTAFMLIAVWINSLLQPMKSEMLGARLQKSLAYVVMATGLAEVVTILTGYRFGALAAPAGLAVAAVLGWALLRRLLGHYYKVTTQAILDETASIPTATAQGPNSDDTE